MTKQKKENYGIPHIKRHLEERTRVPFINDQESLTHQDFKDECDVNKIMSKFEKTGILEHRNNYSGQYGDFTQAPESYHESMNRVLEANEMFASLPAKVRKKFGNDPGQFLEFVDDPKNIDELVEMGLAQKHPEVVETAVTPQPKGENTQVKPPEKPAEKTA